MKRNTYIGLFVACAAAMTSCESAINNFMVDDTVSLLTPGLVKDNVYMGLDDPYEVYVLKSGKGFQSAKVSISVDPAVLAEYNSTADVHLSMMPEDCYEMTLSTLELSVSDYERPFLISWNRERLAEVLAADANIGLPLRLTVESTDVNVNESRLTTIIQPSIETPMISLSSSGLVTGLMPTRRSSIKEDVYMTVETNYIPKEDISYRLVVDPSIVEDYNATHNTDYMVLPEEAYSLEADGWQVKKNMKSGRYKFTFNREALIPENGASRFGEYILPVRLETNSSLANPDKSVMLYSVSVVAAKIDKSKWSVYSCNSDIRTIENWEKTEGDYIADYLIDGTTNKSWRSIWSKATDYPLPHEICIDFGVDRSLYKITIDAPTGVNRRHYNSKAGKVLLADAPEGPWTTIGLWEYPSKGSASYTFDVEPAMGRYMKFVIDESFDGTSKMMIAEISAWGE